MDSILDQPQHRLASIRERARVMQERHFLPPDDDIHFLLNLIAEHHSPAYLMDVAGSPDKIADGLGERCPLCAGTERSK